MLAGEGSRGDGLLVPEEVPIPPIEPIQRTARRGAPCNWSPSPSPPARPDRPDAPAHAAAGWGEPQKAHLRAWRGMSLRHSGQGTVSESGSGRVLRRALSAFMGRTTKKNTATAIERNATTALMNSP